MKCNQCGFENKNNAKFCTKCGSSLAQPAEPIVTQKSGNNTKYIIIALVAVIVVLVGTIGFLAFSNDTGSTESIEAPQNNASEEVESVESENVQTQSISSSKQQPATTTVEDSKSWVSIGKYSGSGSGDQTITVPAGKIMVKLSANPIKNYATNHLYVSGSNGESGGVDWGSKSAVETRSDSFTYTSSSEETFIIDYYETVNWNVEFFRYQ